MRLLALALLAGCTGGAQFTYSGTNMREYFPFDGQRTWTFSNEAGTLPYTMVGTLATETTTAEDGSRVHSIDYTQNCDEDAGCDNGALIRRLELSADFTNGVLLHAYTGAGDERRPFEPPFELASGEMVVGEVAESDVGGVTWTSTFEGFEPCEINWTPEWDRCIHLVVDDAGSGSGLAGHLWAVTNYGMIAFELGDDPGRWELDRATYEN